MLDTDDALRQDWKYAFNTFVPEKTKRLLQPFAAFAEKEFFELQQLGSLDLISFRDVIFRTTGRPAIRILPLSFSRIAPGMCPCADVVYNAKKAWTESAPGISASIRRIFWEDVEEYLERGLPADFRRRADSRIQGAVTVGLLSDLEKAFTATFGTAVRNIGDPHSGTLWDTVNYALLDTVLFSARPPHTFFNSTVKKEAGIYTTKTLHDLCAVLPQAIPIGESIKEPGTWFIWCM